MSFWRVFTSDVLVDGNVAYSPSTNVIIPFNISMCGVGTSKKRSCALYMVNTKMHD